MQIDQSSDPLSHPLDCEKPTRGFNPRMATALLSGALGGMCAGIIDILTAWSHLTQFIPSMLGKLSLAFQVGALYSGPGAILAATLGGMFRLLIGFTHFGSLLFPATAPQLRHARGLGGMEGRFALAVAWEISAFAIFSLVLRFAHSTVAERHNPTLMLAVIICATMGAMVLTLPLSFALARPLATILSAIPAGRIRRKLQSLATPLLSPPVCFSLLLGGFVIRDWINGEKEILFLGGVLAGGCLACSLAWFSSRGLWRRVLEGHSRIRAGMGKEDLTLVAVAVASVWVIAVAVLVNVVVGRIILGRNTSPAVGASLLVGITLVLLWGAMPVISAMAWMVEVLLQRCLPAAWQRRLAHPHAPYIAAAVLLGAIAIGVAVISRAIVPLLHLRPEAVIGLWLAGSVIGHSFVLRISNRVGVRWRGSRWPLAVGLVLALSTVGLSIVYDSANIKAANSWSGLTNPILAGIRRMVDRDRDGFSPILGGGDCDDHNPGVNPLAIDIPGDGVDQNCNGPDAVQPNAEPYVLFQDPLPRAVGMNIVLVTIDCVRSQRVGAYGYTRPTTPNLDDFARKSYVFENAWSNSSFTRPSIATIMTGRYVSQVRFQSEDGLKRIAPDNGTIADVLKKLNYSTAAVVWKPGPLNESLGFFKGFDDSMVVSGKAVNKAGELLRMEADQNVIPLPGKKNSYSEEQIDEAIGWIERKAKSTFFLWVHLIDTHPPYNRHASVPIFGSDDEAMSDHELRYVDRQLGRLFKVLEQDRLIGNTAVFVTSDHGVYHGKHRLPPQGRYLYSDYTSVPLIIRIPGVASGRSNTPVSHIDVLPTIANLVGFPIPSQLPGRSLLSIITRSEKEDRPRSIYQMVSDGDQQRRSVIDGCALLIHNLLPESTYERYDRCRRGDDIIRDEYDPTKDANLRELLSRLEDGAQVSFPAWVP